MPTRVAILGGGMGSLAAAWKLSEPQLGGAFDVTVHQRDGLLGGKGASTRSATEGGGTRIEEHGIHVLMGFYDRTLTLLRQCYAELGGGGGSTGVLPWSEALTPWDSLTIAEQRPTGWEYQRLDFPTNELPFGGDGSLDYVPALFANGVGWFAYFLSRIGITVSVPFMKLLAKLLVLLARLLVFLQSLGLPVSIFYGLVKKGMDAIVKRVWTLVEPLVGPGALVPNQELRWLWMGLWFAGTNLRGMVDEGVLSWPHDFAPMDGQDYKVWLDAQSVVSPPPDLSWDSAPVRGAYDIAFSYGHPLDAGTVLYNLLLIALGYKQHFAFKMNAGMGEVVFAPLHHALEARGVKFEFYSRVTQVSGGSGLSGELEVEKISLEVAPVTPPSPFAQSAVELEDGSSQSLDTWTGLQATALAPPQSKVLHKGADFDVVVLGISVAALPGLCADLAAQDPAFDQMISSLQTVPTQSIQLWLDETVDQLGWTQGAPGLVSFVRPFNSWLDMTHVAKREGWTAPPATIAYFSDEYVDDGSGLAPNAVVWSRLLHFVQSDLDTLWPNFKLDVLRAPSGVLGTDRVAHQYWRANVDDSDRYVIPGAGTTALRLPADGTKFRNLALAGDWVRSELSSGCLEAATRAGFAAAAAIVEGRVQG